MTEEQELRRLERLLKVNSKVTHQIILIKRKYGIGIYCCEDSACSNGWHHSSACKNWVLTF